MSDETGFYKLDVSGLPIILGPSKHVQWALTLSGHPYHAYPCLGWTWRDSGDSGAGYYHTDGSFKSGVPMDGAVFLSLDYTRSTEIAEGWQWFDTIAAAYAAHNMTPPPPQWEASHVYAVDDVISNGGGTYTCIQAGVSSGWGNGPWGNQEYIPDGDCVWAWTA
jgi:hypothetical protein